MTKKSEDGQVGREVLVLLGGAGDLALRMLLPSLYFLEVDRLLPHDLRIIGLARGPGDGDSYRKLVREQLGKRADVEEAAWKRLAARLDYVSVDITQPAGAAALAERIGAHGLSDLLEAAAAFAAYVEGRPSFSRPQIMKKIASFNIEDPFSREDGLRSFGMLLRQGKIHKVKRGQFAIAKTSRFIPEARRMAQ